MSVNVNRSVSDQFYRYKMPRLIAKVIPLLGFVLRPSSFARILKIARPGVDNAKLKLFFSLG